MPLISLRAGRCERRAGTNWVDPQPARGQVSLEQSNDDGLLHFQYKDLESNATVDDLILFPGDATFTKCPSSGGGNAARVYVLKFTSSSARHFYWMQDVSRSSDDRLARRLNALIDDPDAPEDDSNGNGGDSGMQTEQQQSSSTAGQSSSSTQPSSSQQTSTRQAAQNTSQMNLPSGVTSEQMAQLQALLSQSADPSAGGGGGADMSSLVPSVSLADILSPARLVALLDANPSLADSLYSFLPSDTTVVPHNVETLKQVLRSPEVRKSARSLDQALTTGALGPLAASLGMTDEETFGVENYLKGVQRLGDEERRKAGNTGSGDSMPTD